MGIAITGITMITMIGTVVMMMRVIIIMMILMIGIAKYLLAENRRWKNDMNAVGSRALNTSSYCS